MIKPKILFLQRRDQTPFWVIEVGVSSSTLVLILLAFCCAQAIIVGNPQVLARPIQQPFRTEYQMPLIYCLRKNSGTFVLCQNPALGRLSFKKYYFCRHVGASFTAPFQTHVSDTSFCDAEPKVAIHDPDNFVRANSAKLSFKSVAEGTIDR